VVLPDLLGARIGGQLRAVEHDQRDGDLGTDRVQVAVEHLLDDLETGDSNRQDAVLAGDENGERVRGGSRSIHQKLERCLQREDTGLDGYGIGDFQFVGRIEGESELDDFSGKRRGLDCGGNCGGREQGFEPEALACRVVLESDDPRSGPGRVEINKSAFDQLRTGKTAYGFSFSLGCGRRGLRHVKRRFLGLDDRRIAFPTFILKNNERDGDPGIIRIQFGERLVFGNPAAENLVSQHELAGLVVEPQG
jgi:hypothetical protein